MELSEKVVKFIETSTRVAMENGDALISEFMNYMLFEVSLTILTKLVIVVGLLYLLNTVGTILKTKESLVAKDLSSLVNPARVLLAVALLFWSYGSLKEIGKIAISPKIYLIEKAAHLVKGKGE